MPYVQKFITDWTVRSSQKSSLLHDFSDFLDVYDFSDGFTTQSWSEYNVILVQISLWSSLRFNSQTKVQIDEALLLESPTHMQYRIIV